MAKNNDWQRLVYSPEIMVGAGDDADDVLTDDDLPIDDALAQLLEQAQAEFGEPVTGGNFLGSAFPDPQSDPNLFA